MVAVVQDALDIIALQLKDMDETGAVLALGRIATMRSCGGLGLDALLTEHLDRTIQGMKDVQVDAFVVEMLMRRKWFFPTNSVGVEMAVREHLTRQGFAYALEEDEGMYQIVVRNKERQAEGRFATAWYGLLIVWRRVV